MSTTSVVYLDENDNPVAPRIYLARPPVTKDELWEVVRALWGIKIPRKAICPGHVAPFDAFAEGYFGNNANWVLWYGSRGTGKSLLLALLALTKAALLEINVTLLGGSMAQSNNVKEHISTMLRHPAAPTWAVADDIQTQITFTGGNWVRPLPASQKTVRGPHPSLTLLDEIDEMDYAVYVAAMGQAMRKPNVRGIMVDEMTVASSTWQNPLGTFQEVRDAAVENNLPVRTWCYQEVLHTKKNPEGWMDPDFIRRKKASVPAEMFRVEYELGEPAGGNCAFDLTKLNDAFVSMPIVDQFHKTDDDVWVFEAPQPTGSYAAGADWAREKDKTVISVFRTDESKIRLVYLKVVNRRPYPEMAATFNKVINDYHAVAAHDATGIGNVLTDLIDERVLKFVMMGAKRSAMLVSYITAVESGTYRIAIEGPAFLAHKATSVESIYRPSVTGQHLPDITCSMALAHYAFTHGAPIATPAEVVKTAFNSKYSMEADPAYIDEPTGRSGDVNVSSDYRNPYII